MKKLLIIAAAISWLCVAANSALAQSTNFILTCSPSVPANPSCVAVADINGDNQPDLICASGVINGGSGALTILTNDGAGGFVTSATFTFPAPIFSVVAVDVNGDHKPDLACLVNGVTIFTNNGAGVLGSNSTISVGGYGGYEVGPQSLATADVNGDGYPDLLVSPAGLTASIYTNNGSGKFALSTNLSLVRSAPLVTAGSFVWSGSTDVICGGLGEGSLFEVFVNNGKGLLTSNFTFSSGIVPRCIVPADFNIDGKNDLACYDGHTQTVEVFTNLGNATFFKCSNSVPGSFNAFYGNTPWIAAADLNQDKKVDLVVTDPVAKTLTVLTNNGSGSFGSNDTVNVGKQPVFVVAADINGDGKPDLITVNQTDNTLSVFTNATQIPVPPLNIVSVGNQPALFWPSNRWNYVLQMTTNLGSTNWSTVTNGTLNICITVSNAPPAAFFRLQPN